MKSKKVLAEMAKLIADKGIHNAKPMLAEALKEHYGVGGLYFWKDSSDWNYCNEKDPKKMGGLWGNQNCEYMDLDDLERCLSGLKAGYTQIIFEGTRYTDLEEMRRFVLTKQLAGIK